MPALGRPRSSVTAMIVWTLVLVCLRPDRATGSVRHLRTGLGIGFLPRALERGIADEGPDLNALLMSVREPVGLGCALTVALLAGFSSSRPRGVTFREPPIAPRRLTGGIPGPVLGAEAAAAILQVRGFEIGAGGGTVSLLGFEKRWPLDGLAVAGEAAGLAAPPLSLKPRLRQAEVVMIILCDADDENSSALPGREDRSGCGRIPRERSLIPATIGEKPRRPCSSP